jgi:restriction endonuclease Mrr
MLVEIKKRNPNSRISISSVQQLLGAAHAYEDSAALLICTSGFTDSAREFAMRQSPRIRLWALPELEQFAQHRLSSPKIDEVVNIQH